MKYELVLTGKFKRGLKIAKKRGLNISLLEDIVERLLHKIPLEAKNRDHALSGNYKGYRECHIQPDWLLIYLIEDDILTLTLIDTGTHADLFDEYIHKLTEKPAEGERDIFPVGEGNYVRIHMSETDDMPTDDGEKGCLGVIIDASREISEKKKMLYENTHDALTGLCKYAYFRQLAAEILKEAAPEKECAVVMMDLDRFKEINDTFGHNTGDHYLQTFARFMRSMPEEHFLTARRSGDEFCMMIYDCKNKEQVIYHLKEFFRALQDNPVTLPGTEPRVISASAGFQWTDSSDISVAELLSHADEALYEVKRENRGHFREWAADK